MPGKTFALVSLAGSLIALPAMAFEGHIQVTLIQPGEVIPLRYTISAGDLRIESTDTNWPHAINLVNVTSSKITMVFPHNRSFVRLPPLEQRAPESAVAPVPPTMPVPPTLPALQPGAMPGVGAMMRSQVSPGSGNIPMGMMPLEGLALKATDEKTNLLGFACEKYVIQHGTETMEVWATDALVPFQPYLRHQQPRAAQPGIEAQWPRLLAAKKLFPLRASLRSGNSPARFHFEVQSVTPQKLKPEALKLFQPPEGYVEIEPLPF